MQYAVTGSFASQWAVANRALVFHLASLGTELEIKLQPYMRISLINEVGPPCCKAMTVPWEPLGMIVFRMRLFLAPSRTFGGVEVTSEMSKTLLLCYQVL